jgi:hypothetical protein
LRPRAAAQDGLNEVASFREDLVQRLTEAGGAVLRPGKANPGGIGGKDAPLRATGDGDGTWQRLHDLRQILRPGGCCRS